MAKVQIIPIGTKINRLTFLGNYRKIKYRPFGDFECECGTIKTFNYDLVKRNHSKSCGCLRSEMLAAKAGERNVTHGMCVGGKRPALLSTWSGIKNRCRNPNAREYYNYGGRGITMFQDWFEDFQSFHNWSMKNGWAKGLQIDRIDVNGNYEPSNCRWVTSKVNGNNKRNHTWVVYKGIKQNLTQLAEQHNMKPGTLRCRLYKEKLDIETALTRPYKIGRWHQA